MTRSWMLVSGTTERTHCYNNTNSFMSKSYGRHSKTQCTIQKVELRVAHCCGRDLDQYVPGTWLSGTLVGVRGSFFSHKWHFGSVVTRGSIFGGTIILVFTESEVQWVCSRSSCRSVAQWQPSGHNLLHPRKGCAHLRNSVNLYHGAQQR